MSINLNLAMFSSFYFEFLVFWISAKNKITVLFKLFSRLYKVKIVTKTIQNTSQFTFKSICFNLYCRLISHSKLLLQQHIAQLKHTGLYSKFETGMGICLLEKTGICWPITWSTCLFESSSYFSELFFF